MAFLGGHDTQVTLRKTAKTWVTVALIETFPGYSSAVDTLYLLQVFNANWLAQPFVQVYPLAAQFKLIAYRTSSLGEHFMQIPLHFHSSPVKSKNRFAEGS
jgi:hypothetical protein